MDYVRHAVCRMLYADDVCIVSRSPQGLAKMMEGIVEVCRAFALTVSTKKTKTMYIPPPRTPRTMVRIEAAGQIYKQVQSFTYQGGAVTETPDMSVETAKQKTPIVKAEEIESLLYGCSTWTLRQELYAKPRTVHHRVFLRIVRVQRKRPHESIETTLRTRRF